MPINPNLPADGIPASKAELRANLLAAKDGIEGASDTSTGTSPITITNASFGAAPFDAQDYWLKHDNASAVNLTLGTGVPEKKAVMVTQLGAGVINVQATNLLTGAISTTGRYDSLVFRSLGGNQWILCGGALVEAPRAGLQAPAQAAAVGYTRRAFQEEFEDLSGIDVGDTRQPGFNFYRHVPFGFPQTQTNQILVSNSILTVTSPADTAGYAIGSTCGIGNNQWIGFDAVGGAYFEARLAVDPNVTGAHGWPAFWSMASEHLWAASTANDFHELDFFEKLGGVEQYTSNTHDWDYPGPAIQNSSNHFITPGSPFDFADFHVYGTLWVPGSHIAHYRDNVLVHTDLYSAFPWMAGGDDNSYPIILGGDEWPINVDWVRVWQAP